MALSTVAATALAALVVAVVSPYLARLTASVPNRKNVTWWRGRDAPSTSRAAVVLVVGVLCGAAAGAAAAWSADWVAFVWLALVVTPLVVIDVEHHRLPDRLVVAGLGGGTILLGAATLVDGDGPALLRALGAVVAVFAFFGALTLATAFGFGDTKLAAVLAGYLGWLGWGYVLCGLMAGFVVGALVSLPLLLTRRVGLKTALPFGPALVAGALLVSAFGLVPAALA
jgi:leader peptidase (prepilin peptidase) / N-methyltransferase